MGGARRGATAVMGDYVINEATGSFGACLLRVVSWEGLVVVAARSSVLSRPWCPAARGNSPAGETRWAGS